MWKTVVLLLIYFLYFIQSKLIITDFDYHYTKDGVVLRCIYDNGVQDKNDDVQFFVNNSLLYSFDSKNSKQIINNLIDGAQIDAENSNSTHLALKKVEKRISGMFRCVVKSARTIENTRVERKFIFDLPNVGYLIQKLKTTRPYETFNESYKKKEHRYFVQSFKNSNNNKKQPFDRSVNDFKTNNDVVENLRIPIHQTFFYNKTEQSYNLPLSSNLVQNSNAFNVLQKSNGNLDVLNSMKKLDQNFDVNNSKEHRNSQTNRSSKEQHDRQQQRSNYHKERLETSSSEEQFTVTARNAHRPKVGTNYDRLFDLFSQEIEGTKEVSDLVKSLTSSVYTKNNHNKLKKQEQTTNHNSIESNSDALLTNDPFNVILNNNIRKSSERIQDRSKISNQAKFEDKNKIKKYILRTDDLDSKEIALTEQEIESSNEIIKKEYLSFWTRINFIKLYSEIATLKRRIGIPSKNERIQP